MQIKSLANYNYSANLGLKVNIFFYEKYFFILNIGSTFLANDCHINYCHIKQFRIIKYKRKTVHFFTSHKNPFPKLSPHTIYKLFQKMYYAFVFK